MSEKSDYYYDFPDSGGQFHIHKDKNGDIIEARLYAYDRNHWTRISPSEAYIRELEIQKLGIKSKPLDMK